MDRLRAGGVCSGGADVTANDGGGGVSTREIYGDGLSDEIERLSGENARLRLRVRDQMMSLEDVDEIKREQARLKWLFCFDLGCFAALFSIIFAALLYTVLT